MNDPDDPSSRAEHSQIRSEWDKNPSPGSDPVSATNSTSNPKIESDKSSKHGRSKPSRGKRGDLRDRLHRHKHHNVNSSSSDPEKSAAAEGDAQDTAPAPSEPSAVSPAKGAEVKRNIAVRFFITAKEILLSSWLNVLLIFVPIGIAVNFVGLDPAIIFAINAVAIVPLAGLLAHATETVAASLGDTLGALLNVSFGNAVELIIFIIALVKNEINIVQASLVGSILSNLLLILGMAFLLGGLRFREQLYNSTVTQMSACLLSLSVTSLVLPTAFHASFSNVELADSAVLKVSRGTSIILLIVYILYLLFQLKSHSYMYASMPQEQIDEEARPGVLADVFNSSSSDSSSSDSDSSSSSDGSNNTATKRFRRAFKGRRRRKSSASTVDTPSLKSKATRSPSVVTANTANPHVKRTGSDQSVPAALESEVDGNQVDADSNLRQVRSHNDATVQHRDFGGDGTISSGLPGIESGSSSRTPGPVSRTVSFDKDEAAEHSGRKHKHHKFRRYKNREQKSKKSKRKQPATTVEDTELSGPAVTTLAPSRTEPIPRGRPSAVPEDSQDNNNSNRRPLVPIPAVRPQMSKMLSQTVFSSQYNAQALAHTSRPAVPHVPYGPRGLRRTSSLPDMTPGGRRALSVPAHMAHTAPDSSAAAMMAEDEEADPEAAKHQMSRTSAIVLLLISTGLVAICAEFLVGSINDLVTESHVTEAFIGLIILPIVGNAAEHVTAVTVATKNKMDLAIGVAVGSSIQIALFVTPIVVLLGWILDKDMSLYFTLFETVSLFVSAFIVNFLVLDGRSNYLEGALLCAAYIIIAVAAFFYPNCDASSGAVCTANDISSGT